MLLENRVALVMGAGSGIGRSAAILLGREGAKVGVLSRDRDEVKAVVDEITHNGGEAVAQTADVSKPQEMERAVRELLDRWGRMDVVFANAGINGVWAPLDELKPEEWDQTLAVNLTGTFLSVKYAIPALKKQGGSVIVTSSINGTRRFSGTGATAYACTKAAQVAFTKMMALELAKHKVRVNVICPGAIKTEIDENTQQRNVEKEKEPVEYRAGSEIPLTRGSPGSADDVAQLVLFLASDASRHITGTEIWIDGGESLLQ